MVNDSLYCSYKYMYVTHVCKSPNHGGNKDIYSVSGVPIDIIVRLRILSLYPDYACVDEA